MHKLGGGKQKDHKKIIVLPTSCLSHYQNTPRTEPPLAPRATLSSIQKCLAVCFRCHHTGHWIKSCPIKGTFLQNCAQTVGHWKKNNPSSKREGRHFSNPTLMDKNDSPLQWYTFLAPFRSLTPPQSGTDSISYYPND